MIHIEEKTFNDAMTACEAEGAKMLVLRNQNEINLMNTGISFSHNIRKCVVSNTVLY